MNVWPLPRLVFQELGTVQETRPTALIAKSTAWANISSQLTLPLVVQADPLNNERSYVEDLAKNLPSMVEAIYAVGDEDICDIARFIASAHHKPLVIVPTAISSDEPFVNTSTLSDGNRTVELPTGAATEVLIDLDVIRSAPTTTRAVGIVDVLSILTALMDWAYAIQKGKAGDAKLAPWLMSIAAQIAAQAVKLAPALGTGDPEALHTLIDLLCLTVQLDSQQGHRRLSQGTEHIFASAVQLKATVVDVSHAERVGPGLLLATALYNKDVTSLRGALDAAGVRLTQLKTADSRETFLTLPDFARSHGMPFTMLNDLSANSEPLEQALSKSGLFD